MRFTIFITLHALCLTLVHGTFLPSSVSEFSESTSQKASESSFQESNFSTMKNLTQDAAAGFHEFESSATEAAAEATSSFQESSSSFVNQIENLGQNAYESSQSLSSSKTAAESFQESSQSTLESFTSGNAFGQQELSVRASEASESMRAASESSFNAVESSVGGIFGQKEYESSSSQTAESQQKSSLNTMAEGFTNIAGGDLKKFQSSLSEASETLQESSSNAMERSMNCFSGLQGSESSQISTKSSSSASASSNYEQSSQSSTVTGATGFDYNIYMNAFDKCEFMSDKERQCYLKWLETFSGDSLNYYDNILSYLNADKALTEEILDYDLFQKEIVSVHNMLTSNGIYDVSTDLSTKTAIYDKCKSKLRKASKGVSSGSALYKLLKYSATADTTTMPCTVGLLNSIVKSQETYFSKLSSTSSSQSSNSLHSVGTCVDSCA